MQKVSSKTIIAVIVMNIILIAVAVCGKILSRFDYEDHLDDTVITVDDTCITLRDFGYYIYEVETFVQKQALLYDPENPKHWWNTHFSAGPDSQFVCDYAKKAAIYTCVSEEIYQKMAFKEGILLDRTEEEKATSEADLIFTGMNPVQLEVTGLNQEIITGMRKKHALASKYAGYIIESQNLDSCCDEPEKLVNWDGEYYQNEILPHHVVTTNDKVLDKITFGKITVNYD